MSNSFAQKSELQALESLHDVIEIYQEVSAIRMRKVKLSVLESRDYLRDLNVVYQETLSSYLHFLKRVRKDLKTKKTKADKSLFVLMSSNTGLYGQVIRDTFNLFVQDIKSNPDADFIIAGRLGKTWFDNLELGREYEYFDMDDSGHNEVALKTLLGKVLDYGTVIVYHGYFENVLNQIPKKTYITGEVLPADVGKAAPLYLYEPTVEDVLDFFESQILGILFEQALFESSLSKYASRMVSLEESTNKINKLIVKTRLVERKLKFDKLNRAQQTLLSARSLWK